MEGIQPKLKLFAAVVVLVFAVIYLCCSSCSLASQDEGSTDDAASVQGGGSSYDASEIGDISLLTFLDDEEQAAFAEALGAQLESMELEYPSGATIAEVRDQTAEAADIYVTLDGGKVLFCAWSAGAASPFSFAETTMEEAGLASSVSYESAEALAAQAEQRQAEEEAAESAQQQSEQQQASNSGSSSNSQQTAQATGEEVYASDYTALAAVMPQRAAYTLADDIEAYLSAKGISVDGDSALVDLGSVSASGNVTSFTARVASSSGQIKLAIEWNADRSQFGMSAK